jgi:hypothetical protein
VISEYDIVSTAGSEQLSEDDFLVKWQIDVEGGYE